MAHNKTNTPGLQVRGRAIFFLLAVLVMLGGGYFYYYLEIGRIRHEKHQDLAVIGELKVDQIVHWREERQIDARRFAVSPIFQEALRRWLAAPDPDSSLGRDLRRRLQLEQENGVYADVLLLDPEGRVLLAATEDPVPLMMPAALTAVAAALASGRVTLSDLYHSPRHGHAYLDAIAPLADREGRPLAAVVLRSDAATSLFLRIRSWPTRSPSSAAVMFRRDGDDVIVLAGLVENPESSPLVRMPMSLGDLPAVRAAMGEEGIFEGPDYHGLEVVADLRNIPDSDWFLVSKVDRREIMAEARYRAGVMGVLVVMFVLLAAAWTAYGYRQRQAVFHRLREEEVAAAHQELKASQAKLLQQEKLASIGQLAAGVAHEINNPVGFVTSNLNTLRKYLERLTNFITEQQRLLDQEDDAQARREGAAAARRQWKVDFLLEDAPALLRESLEGVERVKVIVQNLKSFSRVDQARHALADLNQCLEETLSIAWNELKYKATVRKEYGELPRTWCWPQQLNQVFLNLLVNAAQAIEKQGEIVIRSWAEGDGVFVTISDTGCGIPPENVQKLFDPFFTTKDVGKGTGLGLSIVYDIVVKQHGGEITVTSEPGRGSTFRVRLPVREQAEAETEAG